MNEITSYENGQSLRKKSMEWLFAEYRLEQICEYISNGGTLVKMCEAAGIQYSSVMRWVNNKEYPERRRVYEIACDDRKEWMIQHLLMELHNISTLDVRQAFDDKGKLLDIKDMPQNITKALQAFETSQEGGTVKVKFLDKIRGIETLGKSLKMFIEMVEHSGVLTLEQMVEGSIPKAPKPPALPDGTKDAETNLDQTVKDGIFPDD